MFELSCKLPIDAVLDQVRSALKGGFLTLTAPPGSGKTTRVPLALLHADWLAGQKIILLEPRRPAARMAALRMAAELSEPVGRTVGYQVRFERCISNDTRIEVLTEGLLTRRLQQDPELKGVGLVIFDEFHERSLHADLAFALCLDVCRGLREDLRLLVMSATLDAERLHTLIGGRLIQAEGGLYPVQINHLPKAEADWFAATLGLTLDAARRHPGDILVFLPGVGELQRMRQSLVQVAISQDIVLLHGQMPASEQQSVLVPSKDHKARIVLSTDIAETSITIEGISVVVDSGRNRRPQFNPNTGLTRLVTASISRASARQRAGRAGRLGPGIAYRAWTEAEHRALDEHIEPEMLRAELSSLVLELAGWGVADPATLSWLTAPPKPAWSQAVELLAELGALDGQARITAAGRAMLRLPLHPRIAHLLLSADRKNLRQAANLAALLSEPDPMQRGRGVLASADLGLRMHALECMQQVTPVPPGFERDRLKSVDRVSQRLMELLRDQRLDVAGVPMAILLSLAFPERIGKRRSGGEYLLASGQGAQLPQDDGLVVQDYLAIGHMDAGSRNGRIWLALPLAEQDILVWHKDRLQSHRVLRWDEIQQRVSALEEVRLGALVLRQRQMQIEDELAATALMLEKLRENKLAALPWTEAARQLQARLALAAIQDSGQGWPDSSDQAILSDLDKHLGSWVAGIHSFKGLQKLDMEQVLTSGLSWAQKQRLASLLPERHQCASGNSYRLDYLARELPTLSLPLQEMYGSPESPKLLGGRLPVLLELLSPAGRPLQITHDLASFWANSYELVKKEMRGRYPKHHWPDDPASAVPVRLKRKL